MNNKNFGFVLSLISLLVDTPKAQIGYPGRGVSQYSLPGIQFPQLSQNPSLFAQQSQFPQSQFTYSNPNLISNEQTQPQLGTPNVRSIALPGSSSPAQQLVPGEVATAVRGGFSIRNGSYILEWEVNNPYITFRAKRRGPGFVGFAISPSGGMAGADIFLAGIDPTGKPFASDYHHEYQAGGIGSAVPDVSNDYQVLDLSESDGYTSVKFRRLLDTHDVTEDHAIENREQNVLWSIGPPSRNLEYHGPTNRGVVQINLVNPPPKFRLQTPLS